MEQHAGGYVVKIIITVRTPYWATTRCVPQTINLSMINDIKIWFNEQYSSCTLENEISMRLFKHCWTFMVFEVSRKTAIKWYTINKSKIVRHMINVLPQAKVHSFTSDLLHCYFFVFPFLIFHCNINEWTWSQYCKSHSSMQIKIDLFFILFRK